MATFYKGDNLHWIKTLPDKSINLIYFDPPFGITKNSWDHKLDWSALFFEFDRVLCDNGNIVIHCSIPFNYTLIREAPRPPSYSWYWKKEAITNPLTVNLQPLRNTEEILVWKGKKHVIYNPQRTGTIERTAVSGEPSAYYGIQPLVRTKKKVIGFYQTHHLDYKRNIQGFSSRPEDMIEMLLKSYTNEGDTVLDPTCYLGISGLVARRMNRRWIGIDLHFMPPWIFASGP
jgi:site-specific DNA-methyltransferase (adenine-specific)